MNFLRRSRRSKEGRKHPLPPSRNGGSWFRKRSATTPSRPIPSYEANKEISQTKIIETVVEQKPDVIPEHETRNAEVVEVQMHSSPTRTSDFLDHSPKKEKYEKRKRAKSLTSSEHDAVGTLDNVLMTFDLDENLNEINVEQATAKTSHEQHSTIVHAITGEPHYSKIDDLRLNAVSNTGATSSESTRNIIMHEPFYSKPVKAKSPLHDHPSKRESVSPQPPAVPPKRFNIEDEEEPSLIKFSDLKKTPSNYLSTALDKSDWANVNVTKSSPKRSTKEGNYKNYSLKRGELSKLRPITAAIEYEKPPPDYETNEVLSSPGVSLVKENWTGSVTSSSTRSGSVKVPKSIRPEVLELIRSKKEKASKIEEVSPHVDGLVKRSFKLIKKSSSSGDELLNHPSKDDYELVRRDSDRWLLKNDRLRANSDGKKNVDSRPSTARSETRSKQNNEEPINEQLPIITPVTENIPTVTKVLEMDQQVIISTTQETTNMQATTAVQTATQSLQLPAKPEPPILPALPNPPILPATPKPPILPVKPKPPILPAKPKPPILPATPVVQSDAETVVENGTMSEDEELVRSMETGIFPENTSDFLNESREGATIPYVPRGLRMSFGSGWEGMRRDRRAWKSREISFMSSQTAPSLSNRIDEQSRETEMLF